MSANGKNLPIEEGMQKCLSPNIKKTMSETYIKKTLSRNGEKDTMYEGLEYNLEGAKERMNIMCVKVCRSVRK